MMENAFAGAEPTSVTDAASEPPTSDSSLFGSADRSDSRPTLTSLDDRDVADIVPADEATDAGTVEPNSETTDAAPTDPDSEATDLVTADPAAEATAAAVVDLRDGTQGALTLGSLAHRLFDTIDQKIAAQHDPDTPIRVESVDERLRTLEFRVESDREVGTAALAGIAERINTVDESVHDLGDRLGGAERRLDTPSEQVRTISSLTDRVTTIEHGVSAPHPHTETIGVITERIDALELLSAPQNGTALEDRIGVIERDYASPRAIADLADRVVRVENVSPGLDFATIADQRLLAIESRLEAMETGGEKGPRSRRKLVVIVVLLLVLAAITAAAIVVALS